MKARESGMPDEGYWKTFFDPDCIVNKLDVTKTGTETVAEFGSGYGTFSLCVASRTSGLVYAFDIDADLVEMVNHKAREQGLTNVRVTMRDFVAEGTGLPDQGVDHAMIYNLLHIEQPVSLIEEAFRILRPGGELSIIHWKHDPSTPRGPSLDIRPTPEQCREWAETAGFELVREHDFTCCCYHYGLLMRHPSMVRR